MLPASWQRKLIRAKISTTESDNERGERVGNAIPGKRRKLFPDGSFCVHLRDAMSARARSREKLLHAAGES